MSVTRILYLVADGTLIAAHRHTLYLHEYSLNFFCVAFYGVSIPIVNEMKIKINS